MATLLVLTPESASFPASNHANLTATNQRPVLEFDATTNETAYWTFVAPSGITGTLTAVIYYIMATATSGDVDVDVSLEAISDGDTVDLDAATSFAAVNSVDNVTVPATAGYLDKISVTLTNDGSITAGDYVRLSLTRDAASDTAAGNLRVLAVEFQDGS